MFESKTKAVVSRAKFFRRVALSLAVAVAVMSFGLSVGMLGYHFIAGLGWIDSLLNASMILTGMGPVETLKTNPAKLFASAYALFSGLVFISVVAITIAPVVHRILHKFHVDDDDFKHKR